MLGKNRYFSICMENWICEDLWRFENWTEICSVLLTCSEVQSAHLPSSSSQVNNCEVIDKNFVSETFNKQIFELFMVTRCAIRQAGELHFSHLFHTKWIFNKFYIFARLLFVSLTLFPVNSRLCSYGGLRFCCSSGLFDFQFTLRLGKFISFLVIFCPEGWTS